MVEMGRRTGSVAGAMVVLVESSHGYINSPSPAEDAVRAVDITTLNVKDYL